MDAGYRIGAEAAEELVGAPLSADEQRLVEKFGLDRAQIGFPAAGAEQLWRARGGGICGGPGDLLSGQRLGGV